MSKGRQMIKLKKKFYPIIIILLLGVVVISCGVKSNKSVDALIIIVGRHANANAFHDVFYEAIEKHLKETVCNGYIGAISSEGIPRVLERFDYFEVNEPNRNKRKKQIDNYTELVLNSLKDEKSTQAETSENDLLRAIQEARRLLNVFDEQAKRDGKCIRKKQIFIMNTGIVTTGVLDFSKHNIDNFDFSVSNEKISKFADIIADRLSNNRSLPNLKDVDIVFIGLGDVAPPQRELSSHVQNGLEILWITILNKANANSIVISPYISTKEANKYTGDESGFPEVKPIEFLETTGWTISNEQINFNFGQWGYRNPNEAENNLRRFADIIIRYINRKPDVKVYVVGSESKNQDREYTTVLSESRAKIVMETLVKFGVPRDKMEVFGLAVYLAGREDDRPNNVFDPEIGKKNQKVVLIPNDIENQTFLQEVLATRDKLYVKQIND
jgi:outer membrane protein OmpA-like peptidoglycan-associated protein